MSYLRKKGFNTKREEILEYLLLNRSSTHECCSLKEIAIALNLSSTGLRHYLNKLENEGLITYTEKQGKPGRPAMIYSLTETGLNTFPKAYTDFSLNLLEEIKSRFGESVTIEILENIGAKNAKKARRQIIANLEEENSIDSLDQKLQRIVEIFHDYGKFPKLIEEKLSFLLKTYNCLYFNIVKEEPLVCKVAETMISELTNCRVVKEKCIRDDEYCLFRIMKN
ncbi:MAG: helix-turn-helix transcriptional regulator [Candidatus Hodarchaeota archaeon]